MNVNGSRFQLLLGRDDWGRCTNRGDDFAVALSTLWDPADVTASPNRAGIPEWDDTRNEIRLWRRLLELPPTASEARLTIDARRAAAADRNGNIYRVGDDRLSLLVTSAGTGNEVAFWPAGPNDCPPASAADRAAFHAVAPASPTTPQRYLALAVTDDDYLVVAFARDTTHGLLSFDLVAGGPPVETIWPSRDFDPFAMCARQGGGVWIVDRTNHRLWELDRKLAVVGAGQSSTVLLETEVADFQPTAGARREQPQVTFPSGFDLGATAVGPIEPIAIQSAGKRIVYVLDRANTTGRARIVRIRRSGSTWLVAASDWLDALPTPPHDFVYAAAPRFQLGLTDKQLFIATTSGNQAFAFTVVDDASGFALRMTTDLFPLRRYAGRALLTVGQQATYDSGLDRPLWTSIVQQPRPSFEANAELVTPVFDSGELGTVWDKLLLDACIPADTSLEIASRASDDRAPATDATMSPAAVSHSIIAPWFTEPAPRLRSTGPELPWLRDDTARPTRRETGTGTWELLLQNARGRYLQLRLRFASRAGISTPRIHALRVWSPRFSYLRRFLPAVYSEDTANGRFLDRWLANFESTMTYLEDAIVNVEALFDARAVPNEALAWLAGWFDVAMDPAWDERRQRLFVQRVMDFFRWRGTVHGLRLALELAFNPCIDAAMFDGPQSTDDGPRRIRIVEAFQRRIVGALAAGDPGAADAEGPRVVRRQSLWTPAEGNAGLADRYARARGLPGASAVEEVTPVSLVPPDSDATALQQWRTFVQSALGFVPAAGAADRARWQRFLAARYPSVTELNQAHGTSYTGFDGVTLPPDLPSNDKAEGDWAAFCKRTDDNGVRRRWEDFLARRYRRVERLQAAHQTSWPDFALVPLPDVLPFTAAAQHDWLQFEGTLMPMSNTAHRFSVLLPIVSVSNQPADLDAQLALAQRIVDLERPAHTVFDVRYYWAFNRVGEARLGLDTQLGTGSRAPELTPPAVLGRAYVGASFVGGPPRPQGRDRLSIDC